jgi:hypothetical protein
MSAMSTTNNLEKNLMPNKDPEELNGINQEKGELRINRERNYITRYCQQSSPEQTKTRIISMV